MSHAAREDGGRASDQANGLSGRHHLPARTDPAKDTNKRVGQTVSHGRTGQHQPDQQSGRKKPSQSDQKVWS